jgi:hypothetical protein
MAKSALRSLFKSIVKTKIGRVIFYLFAFILIPPGAFFAYAAKDAGGPGTAIFIMPLFAGIIFLLFALWGSFFGKD